MVALHYVVLALRDKIWLSRAAAECQHYVVLALRDKVCLSAAAERQHYGRKLPRSVSTTEE
ncbi:MAG: hypothetical protein QGF00_36500, partial [Planctomycetota bacterium]|nr:hypothetical protein [Planctomycetota bacterium]